MKRYEVMANLNGRIDEDVCENGDYLMYEQVKALIDATIKDLRYYADESVTAPPGWLRDNVKEIADKLEKEFK